MSQATRLNIERVVREVLARVGARDSDARRSRSSNDRGCADGGSLRQAAAPTRRPADRRHAASATATTGVDPAWSRSTIDRRPAGRWSNNWWCRPQALVTPAVRDELRRRDVALVRSRPRRPRGRRRCGLVLVGRQAIRPGAAVLDARAGRHRRANANTSDCMIAATDKLAAAVARSQTRSACSGRGTRPPASAWPTATPACGRSWRQRASAARGRVRRGGQCAGRRPAARHRLQKKQIPPRFLPRRNSPCPERV